MKPMKSVIQSCLILPLALAAQQLPLVRQFLVNGDVVALAEAGYSERTIVEMMAAKPNRFDTNADALVDLAAHGISERVVEAMLLAKTCGPECLRNKESRRGNTSQSEASRLPVAAKGVPYRASLDWHADPRCHPVADEVLALAGGALPPGLQLTMLGLEGVPAQTGNFRFTVRTGNGCISRTRNWEVEVTGKPILEASPEQITFTSKAPGEKPAPRSMLVSSTWPDRPYRVEKQNADWLEVHLNTGRTPAANSALTGDTVTLAADPSKLEPGTYRGSLVVSMPDAANVKTIPVSLVVGGD